MNLKTRYKSKSRKRVIRFFVFYSFLSLFLLLYSTFGRYTTIQEGKPRTEIANWNIKINNNDVTSENTMSNIITLVPDVTTQTTTNNELAPGQTGYFDIVINPQETDVSIEYIINFDMTNLPTGVSITSYEIVEDGIANTFTNTSIEGEINLSENTKSLSESDTKTVRVYWSWSDTTTDIPNETDSYSIKVIVSVKQKL